MTEETVTPEVTFGLVVGMWACVAGALVGAWLVWHEWNYRQTHPGAELAGVLMAVGFGMFLLGVGGAFVAKGVRHYLRA